MELNILARDFVHDRIFTSLHIPNEERARMFRSVFLVAALMDWSQYPEDEIKNIGLVYEYLDQAGPRSVNGYPSFMSMKMLNNHDTQYVLDKAKKIHEAEEKAMQEEEPTNATEFL